jgi:hypothetical protein
LDIEIDNLGSPAETRADYIKGEVDSVDTHLYGRFTSWPLFIFLQIFSIIRYCTEEVNCRAFHLL